MPSSKGPKTWRSKAREEPKTNAPSSSADPDGIADALTMAAMQGNVEAVKALLEGGISADCHDAIGVAPLHWAAFCGHGEVTGLLLGARADVTVRDQEGRTPLHVAAYESHMDVIKRLLRAGADMMAPDKSARHALHCPHTLLFSALTPSLFCALCKKQQQWAGRRCTAPPLPATPRRASRSVGPAAGAT